MCKFIREPTYISGYRTSDGVIHADSRTANRVQAELDLHHFVEETSWSSDRAAWLIKHRGDIQTLLTRIEAFQ